MKQLKPKNEADRIRDSKYVAFKRNDLDKLNRAAMYIACPWVFLKFFIGWFSFSLCTLLVWLVSLNHKKGDPYTGWKYTFVKTVIRWCARTCFALYGCYTVDER